MVGIVAGIVICVCSIFALSSFLADITPLLVYVVSYTFTLTHILPLIRTLHSKVT